MEYLWRQAFHFPFVNLLFYNTKAKVIVCMFLTIFFIVISIKFPSPNFCKIKLGLCDLANLLDILEIYVSVAANGGIW